ncbi:protein NLRC3-like [Dysidea avara]|uniref:protein NLRC3-like n=1 Tax=Dysidea avara TaxID=196820 RepID=UPI00331E55CD
MTGDDLNVLLVRNQLCKCYTESRYNLPANDWPPYYPKDYTPSITIYYERRCAEPEVVTTEYVAKNQSTTTTKNLFAPFEGTLLAPYMILIEGASGIGKTILSKEIALQWADKQLLNNKKLLFVATMHDPQIKEITNIESLLKYFCLVDTIIGKVTDWLIQTRGRYISILLDGYEGGFVGDNKSNIINDIIGRKVLTECGLIITSRPTASFHLRDIVDCRAKVLGFTEKDRLDFIQSALQNNIVKIERIKEYLQTNPFLNALCYNPLNMSILLCLAESGVITLPIKQTSFYGRFVVVSVTHILEKNKEFVASNISSLNDLPHPYDQIVKELSQFAFHALQKNQVAFTKTEVDASCPHLTLVSYYSLGLLTPVQNFGCEQKSFHFLHYSIQEYLAAYHIASLPSVELLKLLSDTFWKPYYLNTWIMYVGITGGCDPEFKQLILSDICSPLDSRSSISDEIVMNKLRRLFLFCCLAEIDDHEAVPFDKSFFQEGKVDLSNQSLSVTDVYTLSMLLLRLHIEQWKRLILSNCNIDGSTDDIASVLSYNTKLLELYLNENNLQTDGAIKIAKSLQNTTTLTVFDISNNNIGKEAADDIAVVLSCNTNLQQLYLNNNNLQTEGTIKVAKSLQNIAILTVLNIANNNIGKEAADDIAAILSHKTKLQELLLSNNSLQTEGAIKIAESLQNTTTLTVYTFSKNNIGSEAADKIAAFLSRNTKLQKLYLSDNNLQTEGAIKIANSLQNTTTLTAFGFSNNNIGCEAADIIAAVLSHNTKLQKLYLNNNNLQTVGAIKVAKSLRKAKTLSIFDISNNNIRSEAADEITAVSSPYTKVKWLNQSHKGAM